MLYQWSSILQDDVRDVNARQAVAHLDRKALEDKCLTLMEESLVGGRQLIACEGTRGCVHLGVQSS